MLVYNPERRRPVKPAPRSGRSEPGAAHVHTGDILGFPASGRRVETVTANIGRFRDGQAIEHWSEQGMLATLAQVGLLPAMAPAS